MKTQVVQEMKANATYLMILGSARHQQILFHNINGGEQDLQVILILKLLTIYRYLKDIEVIICGKRTQTLFKISKTNL